MNSEMWPADAELFRQRLQHRLRNQAMVYELTESDVQACLNRILMDNEARTLGTFVEDSTDADYRLMADTALKAQRRILEANAVKGT